MHLTDRSRQLATLLPAVRAGVRAAHLRSTYADDALQQTLIALIPQLPKLAAMPESQRAAYVFVAASRKGMSFRKRLGVQAAMGSDDEVAAWYARAAGPREGSPETRMRVAQAVQRAEAAFEALTTRDRELLVEVADGGVAQASAAERLGVSRGGVAHRLRKAREVLARAWRGTTSWDGRSNG